MEDAPNSQRISNAEGYGQIDTTGVPPSAFYAHEQHESTEGDGDQLKKSSDSHPLLVQFDKTKEGGDRSTLQDRNLS